MQINNVDFIAKNKCGSTEIKQGMYLYHIMYNTLLIPVSACSIKRNQVTFVLCFIVVKLRFLHCVNRNISNNFHNICPLIN